MAGTVGNRVCSTFGIRLPLLMGAITPQPQLGAVVSIAEGVQLGTRLMVTREGAEVFPDYIAKLVLAADDTSTMSATGATRPRVSKPELAERVLGNAKKRAQMGQVAVLIHDVPSVADVIRELFEGGPQRAREMANALEALAKSNSQH